MEKVVWKVEGMTCTNCALTINQYLQKKEVVFKSSSAVQFLPSLYLGSITTHASMAFSFLNESLDSASDLCTRILGGYELFWNQCNKKSTQWYP